MNAVEIEEAISRLAEASFDAERLEKLFVLYTQMIAKQPAAKKVAGAKRARRSS